jgi:YVTN family beta-propeller protein
MAKVVAFRCSRIVGQVLLMCCGLGASTRLSGQTNITVGAAPYALAVNPATNKTYVANMTGNTISVIDGLTGNVTAINVSNTPVAIALNPVTNFIYVANANANSLSVINGATNTVQSSTVATGSSPRSIVVNPVTNKVYVANYGGNSVTIIDGATGSTPATVNTTAPVGNNPNGIALNPVTNQVYVANSGGTTVTVIDGATNNTTPLTVGSNPVALAINPVANKIYVANSGSGSVTVIDGATSATTPVTVGSNPLAVAVNPVTNRIYVANSGSNNMTVIDGATNSTTAVTVGTSPNAVAVNSVTNQIYVANSGSGNATVVNGTTNATRTVTTGTNPRAVAVNPVTNQVFVANNTNPGTVTVFNGAVSTPTTISLGTTAAPAIAQVNPATNTVYVASQASGNLLSGVVTVINGANNSSSTVIVGPSTSLNSGLAVNPATNMIYVLNANSTNVSVINAANNTVASVPAAANAYGLAVNPVTNKIYVAFNGIGNNLRVINGATNTVTSTLTTGGSNARAVAVNPATNRIYVANYSSSSVTVIDGEEDAVIGSPLTVGSVPYAFAVNPVTNKIYVANYGSNSVSVIDGATNIVTTPVTGISGPQAIAVNTVTNRIYVTNYTSSTVTVINGATNTVVSTVSSASLGSVHPVSVVVNPVTNQIYVACANNPGTPATLAIIDGASNQVVSTMATGSTPRNLLYGAPGLAVNSITNKVYIPNDGDGTVTAINVDSHQAVPLTTAITGVVDPLTVSTANVFQTYNPTPTFTVNVQSQYGGSGGYPGGTVTNPSPTQVYYAVDGANPSNLATVTTGNGANPASFSLTVSPQQFGLHTLNVYAAYGNEGGHNSSYSGTGNSPELSNLTAYPFLLAPIPTTTTLVADVNPGSVGSSVTFTATVTPSVMGPSGPTGTISFYDGTALLGSGTVNLVQGSYIVSFATSSLTPGSHTITALYLGDAVYYSSIQTMTETITGSPASIVATGGGNQTTVYGTSFANPLVVTVKDANGLLVSGATVTFSGAGLSFSPRTINTNPSGVAQVTVSPTAVGTFTATASVVGVSTPATFSLTVTKAALTVRANSDERTFGAANPTLTALITGFVNGDTSDVVSGVASLATIATPSSGVGTYPITATQGTLSAANYTFTFVSGTLTVASPDLSTTILSVVPATVMYGDPAVLTAVVAPTGATGAVRFYEGSSNLLGTASLDGSSTAVLSVSTLDAGVHNITANYNGDANVPASTSNTVQLTVTKRTGPGGGPALTVVVNDATRTATQANPPFSYSPAGTLVNGDTFATAITGTPVYSTAAGTTPGTFAITVTGLTSTNYSITFLPGTLTVVETPTATTLLANPTSTQYGDPVTLTATVAPGTATGTAGFFEGAVYLGQATVSGGVSTLTTTLLNAGTHTITATYNGDGTYASSMSGPVTVTVAKKTAPDGLAALTVTVQDESRMFGTADPQFAYVVSGTLVNGDAFATAVTGVPVYIVADTLSSPAGSTYPINVNGLGSQNYVVAVIPGTLTIVTAPTTTSLATSATSTLYGDSITLTATVTPGGGTGTVVFTEGATVLGTGTVLGGVATLMTTGLNAGTHTITSTYLGDTNYGDSTSSPVTVTVAQNTGPNRTTGLTATVMNASRSYGQGNPAFSYTITGSLVNGDTYTTAVFGVPVYSTTAIVVSPPGDYPITIIGGLSSSNYVLSFVNGVLTVSKATPGQGGTQAVTVVSSLNPSVYGNSITLTATVPLDATGTVTFFDGPTALGTGTIANGTATLATSTLVTATHPITAQYGGDNNYNGATSAVLSQVVNPAPGAVNLSVSPNPDTTGSPVTLTATVPAGETGTVTFFNGSTSLGTATISGNTAVLVVSNLSPGTDTITAHYDGDTNHTPATSTSIVLVVGSSSDFSVTNQTPPQLIPPGASATYSIAITSVNAPFTNVVTLTASNLPSGASYSYSPTTVTPGVAGAMSTLTVTVPKQSSALGRGSKTPLMLTAILLPLAALRRSRGGPPRLLLWLLITLTSFGVMSGCGVGGYFSLPQQTYVITVTGTSGTLVHSTTATLTVE